MSYTDDQARRPLLSVRVSRQLRTALRDQACAEHRTLSSLVRHLLETAVASGEPAASSSEGA